MPANTPKGYPYPVGTDRVADGDNAIQALAEAVDTKLVTAIATGTVTVTGNGTPNATAAIAFPAGRFSVPPIVFATAAKDGILAHSGPAIPTAAGGAVGIKRTDDANISGSLSYQVNWLAIQA